MREDWDRRRGGATRANVLMFIQIAALVVQLGAGAIAWGRLDGRLSALEKNVELIMNNEFSHRYQ